MKKLKLIFTVCALALFSACAGDHSSHRVGDTTANGYHVTRDSSNVDTSKVISADNSATGGAALMEKKDTSKMKTDSSK
jgi:hypothetical protein